MTATHICPDCQTTQTNRTFCHYCNGGAVREMTSAEKGEQSRRMMFGESLDAFPSDDEWSRIVD